MTQAMNGTSVANEKKIAGFELCVSSLVMEKKTLGIFTVD